MIYQLHLSRDGSSFFLEADHMAQLRLSMSKAEAGVRALGTSWSELNQTFQEAAGAIGDQRWAGAGEPEA